VGAVKVLVRVSDWGRWTTEPDSADAPAMEVTVSVWERPHKVAVRQELKSKWVASGECMGQIITVSDRTRGAAIKRWREAATYRSG
jgi:hypothetical protein